MTLHDFLAILRQRWRLILATMLAVLAVAAIITIQTQPVYTASTRVHLVAVGSDAEGEPANLYSMPAGELETIIQVASSPAVLGPVREQVGVGPSYPLTVSAEVSGNTTLLDVVVTSRDPQVAADVATAVPQQLAAVAREFSPMLAQSGTSVEARALVPAVAPSRPTSPDVVRNLLVGALAGLLLGVGFALLRHNLDTRVREVRDIEALSDRPVLAKLPARKNPSRQTLFIDTDPFGPHAEAVRRLRTNLMFVDVTTRQHSFVITSASPSEGKTTTAINLAMAMADAGTQVLLVDADLRNPSVATTMGMEGAVGLTTVLLGRAGLEDMAQQWGSSELWVLPAGEIPPNPSELLGSEAMRDLFAEMMNTYEFVLFDTPPVLPVTDALVVEKLTGGTLMVVAANRTRKRHLVEALRLLETTNTKVAGFALNFASTEAASYYGYYRTVEDAKRGSRRGRKKTRRDQAQELDRQGGIQAREAMGEKSTLTEGLDEVRR